MQTDLTIAKMEQQQLQTTKIALTSDDSRDFCYGIGAINHSFSSAPNYVKSSWMGYITNSSYQLMHLGHIIQRLQM